MAGQVKIDLSEFKELSERNADLRVHNHELQVKATELQTELNLLKQKNNETEPVKVVTKIKGIDPYSGRIKDEVLSTITEYKNLSLITAEAKQEAKDALGAEFLTLQKDNIGLKSQIEILGEERQRLLDRHCADFQREIEKFKIKADDLEFSFDNRRKELEQKISDLKDDLKKEKDNKSDAELEAKRIEEIKSLKKRIKTLEEEVNNLMKMSWLKRWWYNITSREAMKDACKEVELEKREADKVGRNNSLSIFSYNPFSFGL